MEVTAVLHKAMAVRAAGKKEMELLKVVAVRIIGKMEKAIGGITERVEKATEMVGKEVRVAATRGVMLIGDRNQVLPILPSQ